MHGTKSLEMTKSSLLMAIFLWASGQTHGQSIIQGKVLDQLPNSPISYVNIGIVNSSLGTISNQDGSFLIRIPEGRQLDTVTFSALGYLRRLVPVQLMQENRVINVFLNPKVEILREVIVSFSKEKKNCDSLQDR
jgi:hypothetical protein